MKLDKLNFLKLKCSYLVYPFSVGQTNGNYFDHRKRIINKDKTDYDFHQKKFNSIKKEIFKYLDKDLIKTKNVSESFSYEKTRNFLIEFIKSQKITTDIYFLKKIIDLNLIWMDNLEISYLIRKSLDQIDSEHAVRCLLISDINSLSYVNWKEFEWFHHPFYNKYKKKIHCI